MEKLDKDSYLKLSKWKRFVYKFKYFFLITIPCVFFKIEILDKDSYLKLNRWKRLGYKIKYFYLITIPRVFFKIEILDPLSYLKLNRWQKLGYKIKYFYLIKIPRFFKNLGLKIWKGIKGFGLGVAHFFKNLVITFKDGDIWTKLSYFFMGIGSFARGQILRGILFALMEIVFIFYMIFVGGYYVGKLNSLGLVQPLDADDNMVPNADNSFRILLYGVLTIFFIIAFIYTWYLNIKQNRINEQIKKDEKAIATTKDDLRAVVDQQFHRTLLSLPTLGIIVFTMLPIVFMILVAFTNYDKNHNGTTNALFGWVGFDNFSHLFSWSNGTNQFTATFGEILLWTLIWAFFATFTNYFLGLVVAMLINKKGIKLKKMWRTILVMSIAVPQFISLLYIKNIFAFDGIINDIIKFFGGQPVHFMDDQATPLMARVTVILINIWIGIPYLMLVTTGILMNIPADLYESASIDGANVFQQYTKITLPYMLFVTGPYLLTSFTGNMNNFNVIYLLTGGAPHPQDWLKVNAGQTDLLITWLFRMTIDESNYALGAVLGIIVFIIVAVISLVVYNILPSTKNEEAFQ